MNTNAYLGYLDINVYSSSSPGMNGCIVPLAKTNGLYFDENPEPQNQEFELVNEILNEEEKSGMLVIHVGGKDAVKYYKAKYKMLKEIQEMTSSKQYNDQLLHLKVNRYSDDKDSFI